MLCQFAVGKFRFHPHTPQLMMSSPSQARPYRSHRHPACKTCRQRKIRCHVDDANQPCRFCAERRLQCAPGQGSYHLSPDSSLRRAEKAASSRRREYDASSRTARQDMFLSPHESSTIIVDPAMAEDIDILERYLTCKHWQARCTQQALQQSVKPLWWICHVSDRGRERCSWVMKQQGLAEHSSSFVLGT